jgi:hypothetical protein
MIPRKLIVCVFAGACLLSLPNLALCQARDEQNGAKKEERVEIKYLVPEDNIETVSRNLHLDADHPSATRVICFYDTDSMTLFNHIPKAILRSRYSTGTDQQIGETTVKIRGGKLEGKDVKCEFDEVIGKDKVESCSLTDETQKVGEIKAANKGTDMNKIFNDEQEDFLNKAGVEVSWKTLTPFGPVEGVKVWKDISAEGLDKVTAERWELPERDGNPKRIVFEISTKVPVSQAAQATTALSKVLGITGTEKQEEETKTKIVLEHFAKTTAAGLKP